MKDNNSSNGSSLLPIYMCIGLSVGMAIGAPTGNIPIGMSIGIGAGLCVGGIIDLINRRSSKNDSQNNDKDIK
jgi:hypothetical protein